MSDEQTTLPAVLDEAERRVFAVLEPTTAAHSGKITERDRELVRLVLESHAAGATQREIAARFAVSRNTVAGLIRRAEAAGKLEPRYSVFCQFMPAVNRRSVSTDQRPRSTT